MANAQIYGKIAPYNPPPWTERLKVKPKYRLKVKVTTVK